jgi:hypothetical protein
MLWFRVRGLSVQVGLLAATTLALLSPPATLTATPSPAGAMVAGACALALALPVGIGWGCGRGDGLLEAVGVRPIRLLDLALALGAAGAASIIAGLLVLSGLAPVGLVAVRAMLVYTGILLLTQPVVGWRIATLAPALYLLAVAVLGRGEDIFHPAAWAWIAADMRDATSWTLTAVVLCVGLAAYLVLPRRNAIARDDD